jgi:hypothetical protein
MSAEVVCNAPIRKEYKAALRALKPILYNLPPVIVVINGRVGSGKTTLGRFLAWRFNITLIETDVFLHRNEGKFSYKKDQIAGVIDHRISGDRPVILEGVVALRLLKELSCDSDFHINLVCDESKGSSITEKEWLKYDAEFSPKDKADLILTLPPHDRVVE